jgi:small subunit ribosomal protein S2
MSQVTMKQLLEAGVHFGHQTSRWNPKMRSYIFGARNGIHIIDLQQTVTLFRDACNFVREVAAGGGSILFVGTKKQAQEPIEAEAQRCGQSYVNNRWLGGALTNFQTIKQSLDRMKRLEETLADPDSMVGLKKKERLMMQRDFDKLRVNLEGLKDMKKLPDAMFVIDPDREDIAVNEANRLRIPVVAVVDTNCDPDRIAYCIPGNDDAIRAIRLFCGAIADSVVEGAREFEERRQATTGDGGVDFGIRETSAAPVTMPDAQGGDAPSSERGAGTTETDRSASAASEHGEESQERGEGTKGSQGSESPAAEAASGSTK